MNFKKDWYNYRLKFMDTNLLARPTLSAPGGLVTPGFTVTLTPAAEAGSSVVYTLDGTDPRLPGGGISPKALVSAGAAVVGVSTNVELFVRSRNPSHSNLTGANNSPSNGPPLNSIWSGPRVASFYVSIPALRITELMYHPYPPPAGNTNDQDNFEYVELTNTGTNALSLIGYRFTNGIDFTFTATNRVTSLAAGGRVLVVKNYAAFATRYPGATNLVAGEYGGNLDNAGERLALIGPMAEPVLDFSYDTTWYPLTDGEGFSLVVVNEGASPGAWTNAAQWRMSAYDGGSPGVADPAPVPVLPVLVNELLPFAAGGGADAVEFYNPNGVAVDIGGWYLTDNYNQPRKYQIAAGTVVPAGGYRVLYETDTFGVVGPTNAYGSTNGFGFSSRGEEVYLFSGDGLGNLTGYYHGFGFGAAEEGLTFGRYVSSEGREHFELEAGPTLGGGNAGPRVGPLVLSELMYHPPDVGTNDNTWDEFIEVQNISADAVLLFDPLAPTNTWELTGGVDYVFPTNLILGAGQYALVVNFDPGNGVLLTNFVAKYGVPAGVLVVGPYGGKLNNLGDTVELKKPYLQLGTAPVWVLMDKIEYSSGAPWPCGTDGTGVSLQRQVAGAFGNDPANWAGALPTAGRANAVVPAGGPVVSVLPIQQIALPNERASFSAAVECSPPPYSYQWWFNGDGHHPRHQRDLCD